MVIHVLLMILVAGIIAIVQWEYFSENRRKMKIFSSIFSTKTKKAIGDKKDSDDSISVDYCSCNFSYTSDASGIYSISSDDKNPIFKKIEDSLNLYLVNNQRSTADFSILKDIVQRNCDSQENAIQTLMPVPLYCGLAGTMLGIIIGVLTLVFSGDLTTLMSAEDTTQGGFGINALLSGVGIAMCASIFGLGLTTWNSLSFRECKSMEEESKNEFLTWMQVAVLPKLNDNLAAVLSKTANQLGAFNETFSLNISQLEDIFKEVKEVGKEQAQAMDAVTRMDFKNLAGALHQFSLCGPHFEKLNDILDVIEERKADLAKVVARVDNDLRGSFESLEANVDERNKQMKKSLINQNEDFQKFFGELKEIFRKHLDTIKKEHIHLIEEQDLKEVTLRDLILKLDAQSKAMNGFASSLNSFIDPMSKSVAQMNGLSSALNNFKLNLVSSPSSIPLESGKGKKGKGGNKTIDFSKNVTPEPPVASEKKENLKEGTQDKPNEVPKSENIGENKIVPNQENKGPKSDESDVLKTDKDSGKKKSFVARFVARFWKKKSMTEPETAISTDKNQQNQSVVHSEDNKEEKTREQDKIGSPLNSESGEEKQDDSEAKNELQSGVTDDSQSGKEPNSEPDTPETAATETPQKENEADQTTVSDNKE